QTGGGAFGSGGIGQLLLGAGQLDRGNFLRFSRDEFLLGMFLRGLPVGFGVTDRRDEILFGFDFGGAFGGLGRFNVFDQSGFGLAFGGGEDDFLFAVRGGERFGVLDALLFRDDGFFHLEPFADDVLDALLLGFDLPIAGDAGERD